MPKRKRPYRRWMREGMGNWRDPNANRAANAERFALARIGMLQEALARQSSRPIAANTPRAGAYTNAQQAFQASQGLDPAARWRMLSQALAAYTTPGTDPRDTIYQFWNP